ncbi:MAG TPA: phosphotransferase [Acidimicrobiales bacterium]|nr:phosphotransferase [Acidimicrobiales bacterium]
MTCGWSTLWRSSSLPSRRRIEGTKEGAVPADELAHSLRRLHGTLGKTQTKLPTFRRAVRRAREALDNDAFMAALAPCDRDFLRVIIDEGVAMLDELSVEEQRLHGEPHDANRLVTANGLRWVDFESCCVGPVEWDLAFQPPEVIEHFRDTDTELLTLLRRLNSARVATWCWGRARSPDMRRHGEMHLASLRRAMGA